jgi:hypothetical protein
MAQPVNDTLPTVNVSQVIGTDPGYVPGTYTGGPVITHQWQRSANGTTGWVDIVGATSLNYTPVDADFGYYLKRVETATNAGGSVSAESAATGRVAYSSLVRWFERPTANIASATNGTGIVADGGNIAYWQDLSSAAQHATQGTAGNQSLRRASDAQLGESIDFVSADALLWTTGLTLNDFTIFAVVSMDALGSFMALIGNSSSNDNTVGVNTTTRISLNGGGAAYNIDLSISIATATKYILCFRRGGVAANNITGYVDNVQRGQTSGNNALTGVNQIGLRNTNLSGWDGRMKALLIFNAALDSTARTAVHNYLNALA